MQNLGLLDFIEISLTYMNNSKYWHIGKISGFGRPLTEKGHQFHMEQMWMLKIYLKNQVYTMRQEIVMWR